MDDCEKRPIKANDSNVVVTENIARICSSKTKLIYISTDQVYGDIIDYSENKENLNPLNQYGKTKLKAEQKVRELCSNCSMWNHLFNSFLIDVKKRSRI